MPSPSESTLLGPTQGSHASPTPSPSASAWSGFASVGQLSTSSHTPSWSKSPLPAQTSQASPTPLPSLSTCRGSGTSGQSSHASPMPSPSVSCCVGLKASGQLSQPWPTPPATPSPSSSGPTEARSIVNPAPSQVFRSAQVAAGLAGKPSSRQTGNDAVALDTVTRTVASTTAEPKSLTSTRKVLHALGLKRERVVASVNVTTSGVSLQVQSSVVETLRSSVPFMKRPKRCEPAPAQSA